MAKSTVVHHVAGCMHGRACGNSDWAITTCKNCLKLKPTHLQYAEKFPITAAPQDAPQDAPRLTNAQQAILDESATPHGTPISMPAPDCGMIAPQDASQETERLNKLVAGVIDYAAQQEDHAGEDYRSGRAIDREDLCDDPSGCTSIGTNLIERPNEATDLLRCAEHTPAAPQQTAGIGSADMISSKGERFDHKTVAPTEVAFVEARKEHIASVRAALNGPRPQHIGGSSKDRRRQRRALARSKQARSGG